jgi:hypothetical protein
VLIPDQRLVGDTVNVIKLKGHGKGIGIGDNAKDDYQDAVNKRTAEAG